MPGATRSQAAKEAAAPVREAEEETDTEVEVAVEEEEVASPLGVAEAAGEETDAEAEAAVEMEDPAHLEKEPLRFGCKLGAFAALRGLTDRHPQAAASS